jgi:hypothetical protein
MVTFLNPLGLPALRGVDLGAAAVQIKQQGKKQQSPPTSWTSDAIDRSATCSI